jgi:hypothetical protein
MWIKKFIFMNDIKLKALKSKAFLDERRYAPFIVYAGLNPAY